MDGFRRSSCKISNVFLIGLLSFVVCANAVKSPVSHYLELRCSPQPGPYNVQAYKCPFQTMENLNNKCIFQGKPLAIREQIPDSGCHYNCVCLQGKPGGKPSLTCAVPGCDDPVTNSSSIYQYKLGGCCSTGQIIGEEKLKQLCKCRVGSKTYLEGQRFYPEGMCKECVCGKGFVGKFASPYCRTIDCGIERHAADKISNRCAPIYYQGSNCCPIAWECYKNTTKITKGKISDYQTKKYQCTFGQVKLNIGDKIVSEDPCVTCSCDYPPLATCIRTKDCVAS